MPDPSASTDAAWIEEASAHALEFLATLAEDTEEAARARAAAWEGLMDTADDAAKFHTMIYTLVWVAHCMRTSANGDTEPGIWTFEIQTPLGTIPVDQADPATRWVARWLIACMNGDSRAASDLWFSDAGSAENAKASIDALMGPLMTFLTHSVREFLRAGRPLVMPGKTD